MASGSTELAAAELERFLTDPTADALALIGDWGSGKTYIWNELLEKVRKNNNAARPGYAYVSLFGISSLAQLNVAIFQHSDGLREGAKTPLEASGLAKLGRLATHLKAVPVLRDYAEALAAASDTPESRAALLALTERVRREIPSPPETIEERRALDASMREVDDAVRARLDEASADEVDALETLLKSRRGGGDVA